MNLAARRCTAFGRTARSCSLLAAFVLSLATPAGAAVRPALAVRPLSDTRNATEPFLACAPAARKQATCFTVVDPVASRSQPLSRTLSPNASAQSAGVDGTGLAPAELQSAYALPSSTAGTGQRVGIVDAYEDPKAESDLAAYRSAYGLPACTQSSGCFKKVNETGGKTYPSAESGWNVEESLDLDMVSAACPRCHILLVEASSASMADLATAENTAAQLGATEISNSWGAPEEAGDSYFDSTFDHPGVPVTVASGDYGYDNHDGGANAPSYPAVSPYVIAVGGTVLTPSASSRKWTETVWPYSGSGCSLYEPKPSFQTDGGCSKRTSNDVAAVAEDLSIYDSSGEYGWISVGGTSAAAPLIAAVEALSPSAAHGEGAATFYKSAASLFAVTSGSNGSCGGSYLCTAGGGYHGPVGFGSPDGALAPAAPSVTSVSPGEGSTAGGATVTIKGSGFVSGASVKFGTSLGKSATVESETELSVKTPAHVAGVVEVRVADKRGTSAAGASYDFVAPPPPTVTSLSPAEGPRAGGTTVTIKGSGFVSGASVKFGTSLGKSVSVRSETELSVKTPAHAAGTVEVLVTDKRGTATEGLSYTFV